MSNKMTPIRAISDYYGETLYLLDDLRDLLDPTGITKVSLYVINNRKDVVNSAIIHDAGVNIFVTRENLDKIIAGVDTPEVKAAGYLVTHGFEFISTSFGETRYRAKDVAACFGYPNPGRAIRKYCKPDAAGYINKDDVALLAIRSNLANAPKLRAVIFDAGRG